MKKTIALFLAALMLVFSLAVCFAVFAEDVTVTPGSMDPVEDEPICEYCGNKHTSYDDATGTIRPFSCFCCVDCYYLDNTKLTKCARDEHGHYSGNKCCDECTGIFPCRCSEKNSECDCPYCGGKSQEKDQGPVEVVPPKAKNIFTSVFTNVVGKLSDVFTKLFKVIFAVFGVDDN